MITIALEKTADQLSILLKQLEQDGEICITCQGITIARLIREQPVQKKIRVAGSACGIISVIQEDNAHLEDFLEYM